jgi:phosphodiesterase/alkaline phosphatase D-like protein
MLRSVSVFGVALLLGTATLATGEPSSSAFAQAGAGASPFPTQTPVSVSGARTEPFAYGVASGDVTSDTAVLWTRTADAGEVQAELAPSADFAQATQLPTIRTDATTDFTVKVLAGGLTPGTRYYYRFRSGGEVSPPGSFRTAYSPNQDVPVSIGFTGDAHWAWKPYPLVGSLAQESLDTFVFLGDLIYESRNLETGKNGTIAAESLDDFRWKYRENREPRPNSATGMVPMRDLYANFGQYSVFDNHETANSKTKGAPPYITGGALTQGEFVNHTEGFQNRIQAYSEYQPVRDIPLDGTGDARFDGTRQFYRAVRWGANMELFLLDDRSYRDAALDDASNPAAYDCGRTMLGHLQLSWFEQQLQAANDTGVAWKLVVISSPIQELGKAFDGTKSWAAGYVCERDQLLKFVDQHGIHNVVFLTTDNHYTAINNLTYNAEPGDPTTPLLPARNAFEIITGPLGADVDAIDQTHNVDVYGLSLRDADRKVVDTWNGDLADAKGKFDGLRQAGFDPIGLESTFPGLVASSVISAGMPAGQIVGGDFVSFRSFSYTVLQLDRSSLSVRVMGMPAVMDPISLYDPVAEQAYEQQTAKEILRFQILAQ